MVVGGGMVLADVLIKAWIESKAAEFILAALGRLQFTILDLTEIFRSFGKQSVQKWHDL